MMHNYQYTKELKELLKKLINSKSRQIIVV
jgi:hypothetical protein